jgi:hypothetical protein
MNTDEITWSCECGNVNAGETCAKCGKPRPPLDQGVLEVCDSIWTTKGRRPQRLKVMFGSLRRRLVESNRSTT